MSLCLNQRIRVWGVGSGDLPSSSLYPIPYTLPSRPVTALEQLEEIQIELAAKGTPDSEVSRKIEQLQESFLRRRGFQPPWERYF